MAIWAIGMLAWGYIRRRRRHSPSLRTIPLYRRFGAYLMVVLLGFDFGLLFTFGLRVLHGGLLIVLIGANIGLATVVFAFRLFSPLKTS
jgi:hypothetical protein